MLFDNVIKIWYFNFVIVVFFINRIAASPLFPIFLWQVDWIPSIFIYRIVKFIADRIAFVIYIFSLNVTRFSEVSVWMY